MQDITAKIQDPAGKQGTGAAEPGNNIQVFPEQEGYLITWKGGSGGGFLISLIYLFVSKKPIHLNISQYGRAHHNVKTLNLNWESSSKLDYNSNHLHKTPVYKIVRPDKSDMPLILYDHHNPDLEELFQIYPKMKVISISIDESDRELLIGNLFFKAEYNTLFDKLKEIKPDIFKKYNSRFDITENDLKKHLSESISSITIEEIYDRNIPIAEKYKERVFKIDFKKLLRDKNYTLSILQSMTNRPIPNYAHDLCDEYLEKQKQLIVTRMPWLLDY